MRVPLSWLRDHVDFELEVRELAHRLDMSGTKVEAIHTPAAVEGIVVAEIQEVDEHPNADNLSLVTVTAGGVTERVVCGAKNFIVGDKVPFAQVGARLPQMQITERKIRGEVSRGMLCSAAELGLSKDSAGLLILQPDAPVGEDVVALLGLDDVVLELEVTPNRPDCMGLVGVAREVAALSGGSLHGLDADVPTADIPADVQVQIEDPGLCSRYLARYLTGVSVKPSPMWMARRLLAAGFRPISNIVDATNYVLIETGQPLHAFDAAHVAANSIVVRVARPGESITTLDGVERHLSERDLVIADPHRALAIAGVMGGLDSEVTEETKEVILESATFAKASIAFTSRRHGLRSEASARFERGTDPEMVPVAAARAARLIHELGNATISATSVDRYPAPFERPRITLRPDRTDALLGFKIEPARQVDHLRSIQIGASLARDLIEVEVPSFRPDLRIEEDLVEEVARLEGLDKLPLTIPAGPAGALTRAQRVERTARRALVMHGLNEAWTSSFAAPADLDRLSLDEDHPARRMVYVSNPMTDQEPALRTMLVPGLLRAVAHNVRNHRPSGVALFELARAYIPSRGDLAEEPLVLTCACSGDRRPQAWNSAARPWDFFALKGVIEAVCGALDVDGLTWEPLGAAPFHPTRGARVGLAGETIGIAGELHPDVCEAFDVPERTVIAELSFDALLRALPARRAAEELPRFPGLLIDIAVVVDNDVPAAVIEETIRRAGEPETAEVRLFDLYRGPQVGDDKKSLAFALELRRPEGTMTDDEATAIRDRIVNALRERTGAELRG